MSTDPNPVHIDLSDAGRFGFKSLQMSLEEGYQAHYFLDDSLIPTQFGHTLSPAIADLLDIAGSIMWVDRKIKRSHDRGRYGQWRGWSRNLSVTLGVRDVSLWTTSPVKSALEELLFWLTEDRWDLNFVHQAGARRPSDLQASLFSSAPQDVKIVLYSGGLDSLAGAVNLLRSHPASTVVLVSAVHNRQRLRRVIERQVIALRRCFGEDRIRFAPLPFHAVNQNWKEQEEEKTQRSRGFLFLAFGAAVATAFAASNVYICENGVGSLNLPMDWYQLGAQNTRATHPLTLVSMAKLLSLIGHSDIHFQAPNMFKTKGEVCVSLQPIEVRKLVRLTVSCDGFPHRFPSPVKDAQLHCGYCTSCILRRQGIFAAGLEDTERPSYYRKDLCFPDGTIRPSYFNHLKKMLDQSYLFAVAEQSPDPIASIQQTFPELVVSSQVIQRNPTAFGLQAGHQSSRALFELLERYAEEWKRFPYRLRAD